MKCHSGLDPESITIRKTIISLRNWIPHQVRDDKNVVCHCMAEFVKQFGIDWRLLVSQAVNFLLVLVVLRDVEVKAKEREVALLESSRRKGEVLIQEARKAIDAEQEKLRAELDREARMLVRTALVRVVEMDPERVDDSFIEKAFIRLRKRA